MGRTDKYFRIQVSDNCQVIITELHLRKLFLLSYLWLKSSLVKYIFVNKSETVTSHSTLSLWTSETQLIFLFHSNAVIWMSSVSICSPCRQATAFSLAEILLQKSIPVIGEPLLNFGITGALISPVRWFNRAMMCGWLYNSFTVPTPFRLLLQSISLSWLHYLCPIRIYFYLYLAEKSMVELLKFLSTGKLLHSWITGYIYFIR